MTRLLLIRHGQTQYNTENRIQGQIDVPLNDLGVEQARSLAKILKQENIIRIISSDLSRAYETAKIIGEPHRITPQLDQRLRELGLGQFEGLKWQKITELTPCMTKLWEKLDIVIAPGGELPIELVARLQNFTQGLKQELKQVMVGTTVIVTHDGPLRILLCLLLDLPLEHLNQFKFENASRTELNYTSKGFVANYINHGFGYYQNV